MKSNSFAERAVKLVINYEKQQGRNVREPTKKQGCDLISSAGFHIEVKSWKDSKLPKHLQVYESIFDYLKKKTWGEIAYYIYLVYDEKNPKLIRITPKHQEWNKIKIRILKQSSFRNIKPVELNKIWIS